jgi:hypothetical protein
MHRSYTSLSIAAAALLVTTSIASAAKPTLTPRPFESRNGLTHLMGDGGGMSTGGSALPFSPLTATKDIDLTGFDAYADFDDVNNSSTLVDLIPNAYVTGITWTGLNFTAISPSWQDDFAISTNRSDNTGAAGTFWDHRPAPGIQTSGTYSGSGAFTNPANQYSSGPFQIGADGKLLVYVYDTFDDIDGGVDEHVNAGTLHVTYQDTAPPPPTPPASIAAMSGGSISTTLAAGEIKWYSFTWAGGAISLDTEGTALSPDNDTEIALYDPATGALIATDDDSGTGNLSLLAGTLDAGNYLLAVGGYNSTFAGAFGASSISTNVGSLTINGLSVAAPEPTTLAALALGGVFLRRRRA